MYVLKVLKCPLKVQGKTFPVKDKLCHSSSECAKDSCCRDDTGRLVDPSGLFDHVGKQLVNTISVGLA